MQKVVFMLVCSFAVYQTASTATPAGVDDRQMARWVEAVQNAAFGVRYAMPCEADESAVSPEERAASAVIEEAIANIPAEHRLAVLNDQSFYRHDITLLHCAVRYNNWIAVQVFLRAGADRTLRGGKTEKKTALEEANEWLALPGRACLRSEMATMQKIVDLLADKGK